jgi:hypothetical protein
VTFCIVLERFKNKSKLAVCEAGLRRGGNTMCTTSTQRKGERTARGPSATSMSGQIGFEIDSLILGCVVIGEKPNPSRPFLRPCLQSWSSGLNASTGSPYESCGVEVTRFSVYWPKLQGEGNFLKLRGIYFAGWSSLRMKDLDIPTQC